MSRAALNSVIDLVAFKISITQKVLAFANLGTEAVYEFDVVDMPFTVAVDAAGTSVHNTGPAEWQRRIATGEFKGIPVSAG